MIARAASMLALLAALAVAAAGCSPSEQRGTQCASGQILCGVCRDPSWFQTDPGNCGGCGISCGHGTCAGGVCQCEGWTLCADQSPRCADLQNDPDNCSACGNACPVPGAGCQGGVCGCYDASHPDDCVTRCTDVLTDPQNCGTTVAAACGYHCPLVNEGCAGGVCGCGGAYPTPCPTAADPAICTSLATDEQNCGTCGTQCATGATCTGGSCACPGGEIPCSNVCVNTQTDASNCNGCGIACGAGSSCCSASCKSTGADNQNCGGCGVQCASGASCTGGACHCPAGPQTGCGGNCCPSGGNACCGSVCQTAHSNGLGDTYFDCGALGTRSLQSATAAAKAWQPGGVATAVSCASLSCLGWKTGSACAVWCYGDDLLGGRVREDSMSPVCLCPDTAFSTWN